MQVAVLTTGADVVTSVLGQPQCDNIITIGDCDTTMPLKGMAVDVNGQNVINIVASQPLMSVFSKLMSQFCGTVVGLVLKVATGQIPVKTNYRFTNNGATTPAIFLTSSKGNGSPIGAISDSLNALQNKVYSSFKFLLITPAANVGSFDVGFSDGTVVSGLTAVDADSLFSLKNQTEANGRLDPVVTGFDNRDGSIAWVRVNATTAVTVLPITF